MDTTTTRFSGSKVALYIGTRLLTVLRDDIPTIPCPNMWDLPGGGADPGEGPWDCLVREVREEVGLDVAAADLLWKRRYDAVHSEGWVMFYVARLPEGTETRITFGDEGQRWTLMEETVFLTLPDAVPSLPPRLAQWVAETGGIGSNIG